jgi:hypothetical protein
MRSTQSDTDAVVRVALSRDRRADKLGPFAQRPHWGPDRPLIGSETNENPCTSRGFVE